MATMTTQTNAVGSFDLLNAAAQERLQQRIVDAGGDSTVVEAQIRGHLERLEQLATEGNQGAKQSLTTDRPFLNAQLIYLERLRRAEAAEQPREYRSLWARISRLWRG
jgi:hypothetical protein